MFFLLFSGSQLRKLHHLNKFSSSDLTIFQVDIPRLLGKIVDSPQLPFFFASQTKIIPTPLLTIPFVSWRIQDNIAGKLKYKAIFIHRDYFVISLKKMAATFMSTIRRRGINAFELAHTFWQIPIKRFNDEMIMITYHTIIMTQPVVISYNRSKDF